jgi:hypothetical protein
MFKMICDLTIGVFVQAHLREWKIWQPEGNQARNLPSTAHRQAISNHLVLNIRMRYRTNKIFIPIFRRILNILSSHKVWSKVFKVLEGRLCFRSDMTGSRIRRHLVKFIGQKNIMEMWVAVGICRSVFGLRQDETCRGLVGAHLMSRVSRSGVGFSVSA